MSKKLLLALLAVVLVVGAVQRRPRATQAELDSTAAPAGEPSTARGAGPAAEPFDLGLLTPPAFDPFDGGRVLARAEPQAQPDPPPLPPIAPLPPAQADPAELARQVRELARGTLHLRGTLLGERPQAMINGQFYGVDQWVEGFRIIAIGERAVVFERDGVRVRLEL